MGVEIGVWPMSCGLEFLEHFLLEDLVFGAHPGRWGICSIHDRPNYIRVCELGPLKVHQPMPILIQDGGQQSVWRFFLLNFERQGREEWK